MMSTPILNDLICHQFLSHIEFFSCRKKLPVEAILLVNHMEIYSLKVLVIHVVKWS